MTLRIFPLLIFAQLSLYALSTFVLVDDALYLDFWGDKLPYERIIQIIEDTKKWQWLTYLFIPFLTLLKCFLVACCLYIGGFLIKSNEGLGSFFKVAVVVEFTSLLPMVAKIIWFGFIHRNYGLEGLTHFAPFSALSLFSKGNVATWFVYPLQLLGLFELLYWMVLAAQLKEPLKRSFAGSLGFVASTYGIGLFIWVLFVMFLTVNLS